jgi:hypothetical protein
MNLNLGFELFRQFDQHFGRAGGQAGAVGDDELNLFHNAIQARAG